MIFKQMNIPDGLKGLEKMVKEEGDRNVMKKVKNILYKK